MSTAGAIGVFDSGIGGLTVLKELLAWLPGESFVYFGDTARVPYGTKSAETVLKFSRENVTFLLDRDVKLIVVACNTVSSGALPRLQREFRIPIVGVIEPGARASIEVSKTGRIGVIGTAGTIRSQAYQEKIRALRPRAEVFAKACPLFVPLVEEGRMHGPITQMVANMYLSSFREKAIDTLVLGCTHYPLLREAISAAVGEGVTLVDSAVETSKEVKRVLDSEGLRGSDAPAEFTVYLSDIAPDFEEVAERILGREIPQTLLRTV